MYKLITTILSGVLLASCGSQITRSYQQGDSGYRVMLHKALVIEPYQARVFIQDGTFFSGGLDEYRPHCGFEVRHLSDQSQTIQPDQFVVSRVQNLIEEVVMLQPVQVAALGETTIGFQDYSPSDIFRGYHFWLRSGTQPDVIRMTCRGALAPPWDAIPPSYQEMNDTLGEYATLRLDQEQPVTPGRF